MGSQIDSQDEFTVLVTGFGPFKAAYPINPSWEIASRLPFRLPPPTRAPTPNPSPSATAPGPSLPPVRILVHPEPIRVNYENVRSLVPTFWDHDRDHGDAIVPDAPALPRRRIDLCVHIGMAGPSMLYNIERRGHRDGYDMPDVDGESLRDQDRQGELGDDWIWAGVPPELETDLDLPDVLKRWRQHSPEDVDLRISEDAGHYLCDFIYFSSLAHLYKRNEYRRVVFLHVPCEASEQALCQGTELTVNLIRALVESEWSRQGEAEHRRNNKVAVEFRA
ncbi:peptidase C15, pyroglutamyl peptidase I-like protein [Sodiomyces alkalinus F11]|uniref:Peptidase C15, pyroglutamyl peptidase I-like protein n=1 Tax=Sodiomyces alkalinus (strain CBS 110278 / VKM F-3762 / F11) TaxID=1314773 RepID=A0A3N2PZ36_SODAK|nr:peptidase C15, pyroglutamyl peptidase I-like protein [Sodiomyces alkalinus F11]ROT39752.1 peptidase C15, pyroglutamyl peptidase I-like protein [Sodiomyces alkalinus F11]